MQLIALNDEFGIPGILRFEQARELTRAIISTPDAKATIYLQGAHLTHWEPTGHAPVLFLSPQTKLVPGIAIRGGIPISFPWFASDRKSDRYQHKPGPAHGFARIQPWTVSFTALAGRDLILTLVLGPTQLSRDMGCGEFRLVYQITIGTSLSLQLTVANDDDVPFTFEEALHTYFAVSDVAETSLTGLEETPFVNKAGGGDAEPAALELLSFTGPTDRVYANTSAACVIRDLTGSREITNRKFNSDTTVVFNPWTEMADLGPGQWKHMLCVETANTGPNAVTLGPRSTHTMGATMAVQGVRS